MNLDRHDQAEALFRGYLAGRRWRSGPFDADARVGLAAALEARGRFAEAEAAYREALAKDPDSPRAPEARMGLARALEALGRRDEAVAVYREVAAETTTFHHRIAAARLAALAPNR
jgi:TolA-binding protein